ncbi:hypothetical protein BDZ97DRAFT_1790173 [Flammula alnicola]|nr:hypothetical protein BDZ97DRAFT_1790173 [Flammula alnicola]
MSSILKMAKKVIIVGGHGNVSMRLANCSPRTLGDFCHQRSCTRRRHQSVSATPLVLSLEDAPAADFSKAFKGYDVALKEQNHCNSVSAMDVRNPDKIPAHYVQRGDIAVSNRRNAFKWIILRPGGLTNNPGAGTASIGRTHLG